MIDDIDAGGDGETEPLQLPEFDEEKLRCKKREELADRPDEELREELERQDEEEKEWRDRFDVDCPGELEATIDEGMDAYERRERRRIACYWKQNQHVRRMIDEVLD